MTAIEFIMLLLAVVFLWLFIPQLARWFLKFFLNKEYVIKKIFRRW